MYSHSAFLTSSTSSKIFSTIVTFVGRVRSHKSARILSQILTNLLKGRVPVDPCHSPQRALRDGNPSTDSSHSCSPTASWHVRHRRYINSVPLSSAPQRRHVSCARFPSVSSDARCECIFLLSTSRRAALLLLMILHWTIVVLLAKRRRGFVMLIVGRSVGVKILTRHSFCVAGAEGGGRGCCGYAPVLESAA